MTKFQVRLVREKSNKKIYAMKKLRKSEMLRRGQVSIVKSYYLQRLGNDWIFPLLKVEHVKAERNVLAEVDSPCIVKLYYSFQDDDYLYLVMEYLPGGDMMTLLMRKDTLSEREARFYVGQAVLAIESIHAHNYIHRFVFQPQDVNFPLASLLSTLITLVPPVVCIPGT